MAFKDYIKSIKINAKKLKKEIGTLYLAYKRKDVPWYAKVSIAIRLIPSDIIEECRKQSEEIFKDGKPGNWIAGGIILLIWVSIILLIVMKLI
ncbi:MAG: hypothetical protein JG764_3 [Clostridiales bacterium]|jgi:hypothetical protein|nr:hypothetical protein [Clostridiales bacterium]